MTDLTSALILVIVGHVCAQLKVLVCAVVSIFLLSNTVINLDSDNSGVKINF